MKNTVEFFLHVTIAILFYGLYFYIENNQKKSIKNNLDTTNSENTFEVRDIQNKTTPNATEDNILVPDATQHGFHDHFAKMNGFDNNKLLGWRYWYLLNKTNYQVEPTNNFKDIPTRQYLDNMESVNNWFYDIYNE